MSVFPREIRRLSRPRGDCTPQGGCDTKPEEAPLGTGLAITWSDGQMQEIDSFTLRRNCPCASCSESRGETSHQRPLPQSSTGSALRKSLLVLSATIEEETNLQEIWPVGNYALGLRWGDGHDTGIYSFSLLRRL